MHVVVVSLLLINTLINGGGWSKNEFKIILKLELFVYFIDVQVL
jgi:hypothetical protein